MMEKLELGTSDLTSENIEKIAELFPQVVTEAFDEEGGLRRVVDFDALRQELSGEIVEGNKERYQFTWPGKQAAKIEARRPINKTMRPCREESVDFDTTENLYIEGDNLDALKILRNTYAGKIKMIYIDPPYNTGNEVIYVDDYVVDRDKYADKSGDYDDYGRRIVANMTSNGRFHSGWCSEQYSRLLLAKDLLSKDGVLFISVDEHEIDNLKKICYEVFGEGNYIGTIVWKNATDNNPTQISIEHEYIVSYCRDKANVESVWKSKVSTVKDLLIRVGNDLNSRFKNPDQLQAAYSEWLRENKFQLWPLDRYKYIDHGGIYTGSQSVHNPGREGYRYDIVHPITKKPCKEPLLGYRFPESTMNGLLESGKILFGEDENKIIELKLYASEYEEKLSSIFELDGRLGSYDLKSLFGDKTIFTNPKPIQLLSRLLSFITSGKDVIIDFYSGSATTGHAVIHTNGLDNGKRIFICIQYPEDLDRTINLADPKTKASIKNAIELLDSLSKPRLLSEIGKERIRRAGTKIKEEAGLLGQNLDIGFRVLKIDSSNFEDTYLTPDKTEQINLAALAGNMKLDRSPEDLLFEVLPAFRIPLSAKIVTETIGGKQVFNVNNGQLLACFDMAIGTEVIEEIAKLKPLYAVFRDASFANDSAAANFEELFKTYSPDTVRKVV